MRLGNAALGVAFIMAPALSWAFVPAKINGGTVTTTSLAARRLMFPTIRRPSLFFPDFDRMFEEMDEMMERSLATTRGPFSLLRGDTAEGLELKRPLGFEVSQDDHEYKVAINVPDVEAKNLDLQLDHDGRVLRLKGDHVQEEGGMKVQSRFEKAILLSPDIDTSKLEANMSEGTLTVIAPKIEMKETLEKVDTKKIEIHFEEPKSSLEPPAESTVATKTTASPESKWPVRDFPY
jgi:HSP20 family protein